MALVRLARPLLRPVGCWRRQISRTFASSSEEFRIEQLDNDFKGEGETFSFSKLKKMNSFPRTYRSGSVRDEQT